ncbi:uncharacterized protein [Pyrus communis]|uniref:uncharacterized protein n=1 Tax=Pyrus communis TaxID=23211 RepID=UPI0035C1664B
MKKLHLSPLKSTNRWDPTLSSNPIHLVTKTTTCWSASPSSPATSAPENPPLDRILLETTGLANPVLLASVLWLDDNLVSSVMLDSIITDVNIINKVDLVSPEGSADFLEELHSINSLASSFFWTVGPMMPR